MRGLQSILGPFSLATGGLGLFAILMSVFLFLFVPEIQDATRTLLGIGLVLIIFFILGAFEQVKTTVLARQARYGTNVLIMTIAFVGIAGAVNFIAANNPKRYDVTESGQFTLAQQTVSILRSLDKPVKVTGFFTPEPASRASQQAAEDLLREYSYHSDKISYDFIDPEEKPAVARQFEIRSYGALIFESDGKRQQIFGIGEQDFTGAVLNVTGQEQKVIYFLAGHGEHDTDSPASDGYQLAREGLAADNYKILTINLSVDPKIPDDVAVLVVAGPQKDLLNQEIAPLEEYLIAGGKALFLMDPSTPPTWRQLLAMWGVKINDGQMVDQLSFAYPDIGTPAAQRDQYYFSQITKDLPTTIFPGASGLTLDIPEDDRENILVLPMIESSFQSWLETSVQEVAFNEGQDLRGPLPLALTVEATAPIGGVPNRPTNGLSQAGAVAPSTENTRFVIFADSDFASNDFFYSLGNSDLFLNTINWLAAQEELISIRPKPPEFRRIVVTQRAWNWILYSSILFLPGIVLMAGGVTWWRRR